MVVELVVVGVSTCPQTSLASLRRQETRHRLTATAFRAEIFTRAEWSSFQVVDVKVSHADAEVRPDRTSSQSEERNLKSVFLSRFGKQLHNQSASSISTGLKHFL